MYLSDINIYVCEYNSKATVNAPVIYNKNKLVKAVYRLMTAFSENVTKRINKLSVKFEVSLVNTFAASYLKNQGLNNSCLKSPASTLVDLTFQSRALRSFSLNQLRNLSL